MSERELHLGLMFWATGTHAAGWRHPDARADAAYDIGLIQEVSQAAERAKFDFVFLGDRLASDPALQHSNPAQISRLEPYSTAMAIAAATTHIGVVVTANPTYSDPYAIARLMASLDHLSDGRAAWNLVTGADAAAAHNFGRDAHWDTARRYDWAEETLRVVRDLWDAAPEPDGTGARRIDHRGEFFSVDGPLDVARPPQGHVVVFNAGTSDRSRELGARDADIVFAGPQPTLAKRREYYADIKARAARHGRADHVAVLPGLTPIVAPTTEEAVALHDRLNALLVLDPEREVGDIVRAGGIGEGHQRNLTSASEVFGVDVRGNDLAAAVPSSTLAAVSEEGARRLTEITRLTRRTVDGPDRITYGDLVHATPAQLSHVVVGNPEEVADMIQEWFEEGAADGFNIYPAYVPGAVTAFTELVVPVLQRRGLFRKEYGGRTLREHLGMAVPPR
ncbi:NtaA/DmoA family FMN-dependent monooxygenase [Streptomyces kaniharaensis]|uniref:NtaA/DmoA family FMN-dependent monooxygenase n=2 Tax=Streptomyces kaniharaensis TaxID=212423 RepID=A0A6N7KIW8_9ACTN|nr:NtaA/DmoA family FMN-dependent monooxygenase [Streptomyces kaniharaensis]MQS11301.1 NtaA/DmoA family FMN-dependent monooxygenase [Streptomyces kaniharaensis]QTK22485.1 xenobiotic compound monooxygenase A subunit [Streptomyces kaniharaensis]